MTHAQLCAIAREVFVEGMDFAEWTEAIKSRAAKLGYSWKSATLIDSAQRVVEKAHGLTFAVAAPPKRLPTDVPPMDERQTRDALDAVRKRWLKDHPLDTPEPEIWRGCYDDSWKGVIVAEAFAHPAKMARGLLERIFRTLTDMRVLRRHDLVVDPFGGIGTTGVVGAYRGMRVVCVELEPKFVELAARNFNLHAGNIAFMNHPRPLVVQGDSRKIRRYVDAGMQAAAVIASPPYAAIAAGAGGLNTQEPREQGQQSGRDPESPSQSADQRYGDKPGQLARMAEGTVDAVVSSPPYVSGGHHPDQTGTWNTNGRGQGGSPQVAGYGRSEGQLGQMEAGPVDAVISSPPFPQPYTGGGGINKRGYNPEGGEGTDKVGERTYQAQGGERQTENIELLEGETFWSAAKQVVEECHALLKPGGMAVWVVKAYVKNKRIVDFPGDWRKLCEHIGFETEKVVHAMLVEEHVAGHLFDGEVVKRHERKSFFRRLAEKKGSPAIDYEVVLFTRKSEAPHADSTAAGSARSGA